MSNYPPVSHNPMPPAVASINWVAAFPGWLNVSADGAGQPFQCPAGSSLAVIMLTNASTMILSGQYYVLARWGGGANEILYVDPTSPGGFMQMFSCSAGRTYYFTIYFKPGFCPPVGADIGFNLQWL